MMKIPSVSSSKILRVTFSDKLCWNTYFNTVRRPVNVISNLKQADMEPSSFWRMYSALIRPVLTYGLPSICNALDFFLLSLSRVEKCASVTSTITRRAFLTSLMICIIHSSRR